jgi:hypothetical protein
MFFLDSLLFARCACNAVGRGLNIVQSVGLDINMKDNRRGFFKALVGGFAIAPIIKFLPTKAIKPLPAPGLPAPGLHNFVSYNFVHVAKILDTSNHIGGTYRYLGD